MAAGADMSSVSMHKSGGSSRKAHSLLCGKNVNSQYVRQIPTLTDNQWFLSFAVKSDISRRNLALHGKDIFPVCRKWLNMPGMK